MRIPVPGIPFDVSYTLFADPAASWPDWVKATLNGSNLADGEEFDFRDTSLC